MKIVELSGVYPDIALAELTTFTSAARIGHHLYLVDDAPVARLSYVTSAYEVLTESSEETLEKDIAAFDWNAVYKESFVLRVVGTSIGREPVLGHLVGKSITDPKVNCRNPKTPLFFFFLDKVYFTRKIYQRSKDFLERFPHTLPVHHPAGLNPYLARAMVNLTGAPIGSTIVDPFCGIGISLIEGSLIGMNMIGSDIDGRMLKRARKNIEKFEYQIPLEKKDALTLGPVEYVVGDLPYGKSTYTSKPILQLYTTFMQVLEKNLKKCAVLGVSGAVDHKELCKNLNLCYAFKIVLNDSLQRWILVIKPK